MAAQSQLTPPGVPEKQKLKEILAKNLGETLTSFGTMKEEFCATTKIFNDDSPHSSCKENETPSFSTSHSKFGKKRVKTTETVGTQNYENLVQVLKKLKQTEANHPVEMSFDGSVFEIRRIRDEPKRYCECPNSLLNR
jgi:hypothetical protein